MAERERDDELDVEEDDVTGRAVDEDDEFADEEGDGEDEVIGDDEETRRNP